MSNFHIFIVEDDKWYGEILQYNFSLNPDYKITRFETAKEFLNNLYLQPDLVTIDFSLPDMPGDKLYKKIREVNAHVPVIVISSQQDITIAVNLLKMGVSDHVVKDEATKELLGNSIVRIRDTQTLKQEVSFLKEEPGQKFSFEKNRIGQSDALKKIFVMMEKAIKTNINVSITGETGTGKELVAKAIHYNSDRRKGTCVPVNMAAITHELVESELFGYEKGAFTGANARKIGKFEEANGRTVFLDEIAELMGLPIELPPLRERGNDVLILAKHFIDEFARQNKMGVINLSNDAKNKLIRYNFPGNVRVLKAIMDLACVMCNNNEIITDDITFNFIKRDNGFLTEQKTLRQYTCDIIKCYLKKNNNDVIATAALLDIGKSTVYKMIQERELN
ncbi:MAG TPA: sigma 54-interacting transcriptional regulator [Mucilaginibacter sp.]|nr:sigma 54-interacting transcriptional regulator [Mucilaginibacter sp.]